MKYFNSKQDEIDHIIDSQTTALKAIRLEAFLPPVRKERIDINDNLNQIEKRRLESILDDNMNSLFERRLN